MPFRETVPRPPSHDTGPMPILRHDLTRAARRGRLTLVRTLYALALLATVGLAFVAQFKVGGLTDAHVLSPKDMARFSADFAARCAWVQLIAVIVLAPALAAPALADERQRGTLDLLRMTGLRSGVIVRGKLFSRVAQLLSVLLIGVPIGAVMLLLGGVDWRYPVGSFILSAGLAASLAALGLTCSARAKSVPAAMVTTYGIGCLAYLITVVVPHGWFANPLSFLASWSAEYPAAWFTGALTCTAIHVIAALVLAQVASRLLTPDRDAREHAVAEAVRLSRRANRGGFRAPPSDIAVLAGAAFDLLRRPAPSPVPSAKALRVFPVPPIEGDPLLWKELHFGGNPAIGELIRSIGCLILMLEALVAGVAIFLLALVNEPPKAVVRDIGEMARGLAVLSLAGMAVAVTGYAAGSVSREREQKTLDALLTLPFGRGAVLRAKWIGSVLRGRWPWATAVVALTIGCVVGDLHPLGALAVALVAVVHAGFFAAVGVWLSVVCAGTGRAVVIAGVLLVGLIAVPWALADAAPYVYPFSRAFDDLLRSGALNPMTAWARAAHRTLPPLWLGHLVAAGVYFGAALVFVGLARWRFRRETIAWSGSRS